MQLNNGKTKNWCNTTEVFPCNASKFFFRILAVSTAILKVMKEGTAKKEWRKQKHFRKK